MTTSNATQPGVMFGPTNSGKRYIAVYKHRGSGSRKYKTVWDASVSPEMEYGIFCRADDGDWRCPDGHYWGVQTEDGNILTQLGQGGERLCKFPRTSNANDPWHGFPVLSSEHRPPDEFVKEWRERGVISRTIEKRIQKGKL